MWVFGALGKGKGESWGWEVVKWSGREKPEEEPGR